MIWLHSKIDKQELDRLGGKLEDNLGKTEDANDKLKDLLNSTSGSILNYWIAVVFSVVIFMFVYIFMRLVPK